MGNDMVGNNPEKKSLSRKLFEVMKEKKETPTKKRKENRLSKDRLCHMIWHGLE